MNQKLRSFSKAKEESDILRQMESFAQLNSIKNDTNSPFSDKFSAIIRYWSSAFFNNRKKINVLSLFSGGGGLDIGFHDCGFSVKTMVEIDPKFTATLKENVGTGKYFGSKINVETIDINQYDSSQLKNIDFIIGGPPCQTFSSAGRRAAGVLGFYDPRGLLFKAYVKLLENLNPKGFLFENVYGLTGAQNGEAWNEIIQAFSSTGYKMHTRVLDAADYGVPQHRERVFIVGTKDANYKFPRPTHGPDSYYGLKHISATEVLKGITTKHEKKQFGGRYGHLLHQIPPGLNYSFFTSKLRYPKPVFAWRSKFSDFLYKADPNLPIRTVKASGGKYTGPLHWDNRHFTTEELKRLQTFPDDYVILGNNSTIIRQIGNSVPPQLARILALSVLENVFQVPIPIKLQYLEHEDILTFRQRKQELTKYYEKLAKDYNSKTQRAIHTSKNLNRTFHLNITDSFDITEATKEAEIAVSTKLESGSMERKLKMDVRIKKKTGQLQKIKITLENVKWDIPFSSIIITSNVHEHIDWTKMWKSIEFSIKKLFGIDDLVQLRNYYQYPPTFRIHILPNNIFNDDLFKIIKTISEDSICGHILSEETLAEKLKINKKEVLNSALRLKQLGFEIRNNKTNPQILNGYYLIPYPFPTLNIKSVQFKKPLI